MSLALHPAGGTDIHLCNAYTLALADSEASFKRLLNAASRNYPDGMSVVWTIRLQCAQREVPRERVYGPDLMLDVLNLGRKNQLRHFLLGASPQVLRALEGSIRRRFPGVLIVGRESPPFRALTPAERKAQGDRLRLSNAQVVWLGLGTPKQDWEAAALAQEHDAVFIAVGAAFDFIAGAKKQAPMWMRRRGIEWLFRFITEPRRLWRRYIFGNSRFVWAVIRQWSRSTQSR